MFEQSGEQIVKSDKWYQLRFAAYEAQIEWLFTLLRKYQIEPILIKGWAASRLYPRPYERYFSDIDLAVDPKVYEQGLEILKNHHEFPVDLHRGLRHLDTLSWESLAAHSKLVDCRGVKIRILSEEDHLRVLAVHWLQDGGAYKHRLQDIFYAVVNQSADFDWAQCLNVVDQKRRQWVIAVIAVAVKHLGLDIENLPIKNEVGTVPQWVFQAVETEWKSGVRLQPLDQTFDHPKRFYQQVLKRLNPNPIQAMIEVNGSLTGTPLAILKIASIYVRTLGSVKRIIKKHRTK